jgi:hypothetical protein
MSYDVSVGVRRSAPGLQQQVNAALAAEGSAIAKLLASYHVPLLASSSAVSLAAR